MEFQYNAQPHSVVFGAGSVARLADVISPTAADRVIFIASRRWRDVITEVAATLGDRPADVFDDIQQHTPEDAVARVRTFAADRSATHVVCIGGGSAVGLGKAVAVDPGADLIVVPTTYSGSEMTQTFGITSGGVKRTNDDPRALAKVIVYDPELTASLPAKTAGPSAMNALAHAVEALYSPRSNPITAATSVQSIVTITQALTRVLDEPADLEARTHLLFGACLAGLCLANAGMSFHHRICHVLGGRFNLPHAETHAAILPHSVALLRTTLPLPYATLQRVLDTEEPEDALFDLLSRVLQPIGLAHYGLSEAAAVEAAAPVFERVRDLVPVTQDDMAGLLRRAARGERS